MSKFKKIIVFLCLFLLSFSIVTDFKRQETQAIALVDDALLWAFGMLVLGTGVVAIKDIQVPHMGSLVLDNLKSSGVSEEEFLIKSADGVLKGIKIYDKVLNAVDSVSLNLPVKDYDYFDSISSNNVDSYKVTIGSFPVVKSRPSSLESENLSDLGAFVGSFSYTQKSSYYFNGVLAERLDNPPGEVMFFGCSYNNVNYIGRVYYNTSYKKYMYSSTKSYTGSAEFQFNGNSLLNTGTYTNIPYSLPQIKQGYNPTYTDINFPYTAEKPGFMPLPTDTIIDKPISTELPLTWDDVKGGVTDLPVDDTIPGEDTGEGDIEAPSIWGWLLDILKSILNAIKSILSFITDFLAALLEGLKDLLLSLLVPSDTYFTDSFTDIKNNLSNRLNIDSYTRLFNSDYNDSSIRDITINWHGQEIVIVKFTMYENFRNIVNTLIYAFMFFLLAIYNYSQVYKLIRGSDYVSASSTITHIGGGFTDSDMRKIISHEKPYIKLGSGKK